MSKYAPFNKKQAKFIKESINGRYWLNVLEGGKRAGKNVISIISFAALLEEHPDKIHLAAGYTNATAQTNIIDCNGFGIEHIFKGRCRWGKYKDNSALYIQTKTGEKIVVVVGGGKSDSFKRIKGNTYGMAYLDEVNEMHETFIKETIDRTLASSEIKHIWTLNPKTPRHKFYTDILDKLTKSEDVLYQHFNIFDNMAISDERLEQIKGMYDPKSVWYKRDILGHRVAAEGRIYINFSAEKVMKKLSDKRYQEYSCGIDVGGTDATVFTFCGFYQDFKKLDVIDTYYHKNNNKNEPEKSMEGYIDDFIEWSKKIKKKYPRWKNVYVDSANKLFRLAIQERVKKEGLNLFVYPAYKKDGILYRIKLTQLLFMNDRIIISDASQHLREAFEQALWDSAAAEKGLQERLDDGTSDIDSLDSFEYAITPFSEKLVRGLNYE